jgi:hypothetical protein
VDEVVVATKWQPGVSANPGGRPKWLKEMREQMREHVPAAVAKIVAIMGGKVDGKDVTLRMQMEAAREILDRVLGKPAQTIQGPDESPLLPLNGNSLPVIEVGRRVAFLLAQGLEAQELARVGSAPSLDALEINGEPNGQ